MAFEMHQTASYFPPEYPLVALMIKTNRIPSDLQGLIHTEQTPRKIMSNPKLLFYKDITTYPKTEKLRHLTRDLEFPTESTFEV